MAKHNVLFETDNFIPSCINRGGIATVDIDGGTALAVGDYDTKDKELYTVTKADAGAKEVAIAFNPSVKYDIIGDNLYPARSKDDRNYTNPAKHPLDFFIPKANIEFGILAHGIKGAAPTKGQFLEPSADGWVTKATQTADVASFKVVDIVDGAKYPTFNFDDDTEKVYILKTVFNG